MKPLTYGSVCSGIEAASCAWHPLGWKAAFVSEIEAFPRAVLSHHYPETPLHGDFTTIRAGDYDPIDLLVGGTPCQSFSVAGLRGGLDDDRGNLALEFLRLAQRTRPRWLVWENVPGVLSSAGGRDFGAILGGLVELGYGFAYRVLDAQYFGVAQRRRRVFVVGHLGDWRRAAAVLFERHSLSGHPSPRRETGKVLAGTIGASSGDWSRDNIGESLVSSAGGDLAATLGAKKSGGWRGDLDNETYVAQTFSIMPQNSGKDYKAREVEVAQPIMAGGPVGGNQGGDYIVQPIAFSSKDHGADAEHDLSPTLRAGGHNGSHANAGVPPAIAFAQNQRDEVRLMNVAGALAAEPGAKQQTYAHVGSAVRRLTPRECERLQGFPDDYTLIPWRKGMAPDGPRYKALGNSMAVPVMRWVGERIRAVDAITTDQQEAA